MHIRKPSTTDIINQTSLTLNRVRRHRAFIEKEPCPNCGKLSLKLLLYSQDKRGYELQIMCNTQKCKTVAVMNDQGLKFNLSGVPEEPETKKETKR